VRLELWLGVVGSLAGEGERSGVDLGQDSVLTKRLSSARMDSMCLGSMPRSRLSHRSRARSGRLAPVKTVRICW